MTELILHSANLDQRLPSGSLAALELSLKAGTSRIEVDIIPLKGGDFALIHDPQLEHFSNGSGSVAQQTSQIIQQLIYKHSNRFSEKIKLGTLSQAVRLLQTHSITGFLQLDLKPYTPLTPSNLQNLINLTRPVQNKIMVSSVADWAIRIINKMAPDLMLGFDPLLYLDLVQDDPREEGVPPFRVGAYGYLDEHPLAAQRWGELKAYFSARAEALLQQVPEGVTWFINAQLLDEAMISGFNWISYLHDHGCRVNAWTLDMDRSELAGKMAASGVDLITTNQLPEMTSYLNK
jgi:glycerophosphoryl diester phosphodiesterase